MTKLSEAKIQFLKLVERSPDIGDEWRKVGHQMWRFAVEGHGKMPELLELDIEKRRIRLTEKGKIVMEYLI